MLGLSNFAQNPNVAFSHEYRVVIEDGSGEAHLYAESNRLRQLLRMSGSEWSNLCDLVRSVGTIFYNKPFSNKQPVRYLRTLYM